jgi:hypothetical protein
MTATFRCLISGQTVTFEHQVDIDSMKGHPDYEPVVMEEATEEPAKKPVGRPSKKTETTTPEVE